MWSLIGGLLLGWGLGSNDSANIFGAAVASNVIKYRKAILLTSLFVVLGALLEGYKSMGTVGEMSRMTETGAFLATLSAGLCMGLFSYLSIPVSASQAIMGGVLGIGMLAGIPDLTKLYKVLMCWLLTPMSGVFFTAILYPSVGRFFQKYLLNIRLRSGIIYLALLASGCYGAYALGANNVANVTGVYVGSGLLSPLEASLIGSIAIVSGVVTYSKKVMYTIGRRIVELDNFSAFVSTLSAAITTHLFTQVGVPVSTSQAIVGAVAGIGIVKGSQTLRIKVLLEIAAGWMVTPLFSGVAAYLLMRILVAI